MEVYQYIVLLHIAGSFGIFTGWGMEIAIIRKFEGAVNAGQITETLSDYKKAGKFSVISMLVTFGAGVYLMITAWGQQAWIAGAVLTLLLLIATSIFYSRKALPVLKSMSKTGDHFYMPAYLTRIYYLILSIRIKFTFGISILALMVLKPKMAGTILIFLVTGLLIISILLLSRKKQSAHI